MGTLNDLYQSQGIIYKPSIKPKIGQPKIRRFKETKKVNLISIDEILERFTYDAVSGTLYHGWKSRTTRHCGAVAGYMHAQNNAHYINLNKDIYKLCVIVWAYNRKAFPERSLYHRNGNFSDFRMVNLMEIADA